MSERFGGLCAAEHKDGSIGRIRQGSGHHQLAAIVGFLDQREVLGAKRSAPFDVIVHDVIEQEEVHDTVKDTVFPAGLDYALTA